ncbi:MAG TPA: hypothetical protein VM163_05195 [bacterium]|nr:hypothetical protein [bacterium]
MATYLYIIKKLMQPNAIPSAQRARLMSDLVMSFRNDPLVQRLLKAGRHAAPLICWELRKNGAATPRLAQACLFWILCQTAPDTAAHLVMAPLASPTDHSAALLKSLAPQWISRELLLAGRMTGSQSGESHATAILASILSIDRYQRGTVSPELWPIPGITNWDGEDTGDTHFGWAVPAEEGGRTEDNWCTVRWPPPREAPFEGADRVVLEGEPPVYAPFLGETCKYFHFDRSWELLGPTGRYFCAGLIWLPRRAWSPGELHILTKDLEQVLSDDDVRVGDIVEYAVGHHWAVVWKVAPVNVKARYVVEHAWNTPAGPSGHVTVQYETRVLHVRSKLNEVYQEAIHSPYDQALFYQNKWQPQDFPVKIWRWKRNHCLRGNIIDLWIKTHPDDDGAPYSQETFWESPDIKIVEGPFPDVSKEQWYERAVDVGDEIKFGLKYRIWAQVRNRGDRDLDGEPAQGGYPWTWKWPPGAERKHWFGNAYIRYYWAYSGTPQMDDWQIIRPPAAEGGGGAPHFGPFTVPRRAGCDGNAEVNAPFADWTPPQLIDPSTGQTVSGSHVCFLAVVYAICKCENHRGFPPGDDPKNRCNPDPIVYPWEPAWDNNIAMRNISAISLEPAQAITLHRLLGTPHDLESIEGALEAVVSHPFETARQGQTEDPAPLQVFLRTCGDSEALTTINEYKEKGILFLPDDNKGLEKRMGGVVLPYKLMGGKRTNTFDVKIRVPKKAKPGSVYYVRIAQNLHGRIVSGCTTVVRVI